MKRFVAISFLSAFLVACGGNDKQKFIGEWIDPEPKPASQFDPGLDRSRVITDAGGDKVFITFDVWGNTQKHTSKVVKNSIVDETGKVEYELISDTKLRIVSSDKILNKK